jgi:hypothetical protein
MSLSAVNPNISSESSSIINESTSARGKTFCKANLVMNIFSSCMPIVLLAKATSYYTISPLTTFFLHRVAGTCILLNLFSGCLRTYLNCHHLHQEHSNNSKYGFYLFRSFNEWIPSLGFSIFFGMTGNMLIHELGHVVAASTVYSNLTSQIRLTGIFKAAVTWDKSCNTMFGNVIGDLSSRLLVCMAGPLAATFVGTLGLIAGFHLKERFPEFSKYLTLSSLITIACQVLYALTAILAFESDLGHDFVMLWQVGIHPIVSSLILASFPIIALVAYRLKKSHSE